MERKPTYRRENGNALFLILIAVALFAALSYAVTKSGTGSGDVNREKSIIMASEVTDRAAAVRSAVTRVLISGVPAGEITFTGTGATSDVFYGGVVLDLAPPPEACSPSCTTWEYIGFTDATHGLFVGGVKTNAPEEFAILPQVTAAVCREIQKGLGFASVVPPVQDTAAFDWTNITGVISQAGGLKGSATTIWEATLTGKEFACVDNRSTSYFYYHVLLPQ